MCWGIVASIGVAIADAENERRFYETVGEAPIGMRATMVAAHQKARKEAQERAEENRRHRELVDAIRERNRPTVVYRDSSYGCGSSGFLPGFLVGRLLG